MPSRYRLASGLTDFVGRCADDRRRCWQGGVRDRAAEANPGDRDAAQADVELERVIRPGPGALADDTGTEVPGMPGNSGLAFASDTDVVIWTIPLGPGRPELVDLCP